MGYDADAYLFFGYCWPDEESLLPESFDGEWDKFLAVKRGHVNPWDAMPDYQAEFPYKEARIKSDEWVRDHRAEIDAWHATLGQIRDESLVELSSHGSPEYRCPLVRIKGAGVWAYMGTPRPVDLIAHAQAADVEGWTFMLNQFLEDLEIDKPQDQPQWWLATYLSY